MTYSAKYKDLPVLYIIAKTPVKLHWSFVLNVPLFWAGLIFLTRWRFPSYSPICISLIGLAALHVFMFAEIGHGVGHAVVSRWWIGVPMSLLLLQFGMTRTLYDENSVHPTIHIKRSLGGPLFSLIMFGLSILLRVSAASDTVLRFLLDVSALSHGVNVLGTFLPFPLIDGGVLLKWSLVLLGLKEHTADRVVMVLAMCLIGSGLAAAGVFLYFQIM